MAENWTQGGKKLVAQEEHRDLVFWVITAADKEEVVRQI